MKSIDKNSIAILRQRTGLSEQEALAAIRTTQSEIDYYICNGDVADAGLVLEMELGINELRLDLIGI